MHRMDRIAQIELHLDDLEEFTTTWKLQHKQGEPPYQSAKISWLEGFLADAKRILGSGA